MRALRNVDPRIHQWKGRRACQVDARAAGDAVITPHRIRERNTVDRHCQIGKHRARSSSDRVSKGHGVVRTLLPRLGLGKGNPMVRYVPVSRAYIPGEIGRIRQSNGSQHVAVYTM